MLKGACKLPSLMVVLALAACAQNAIVDQESEAPAPAEQSPAVTESHAHPALQSEEAEATPLAGPDYATLNPVPIEFDPLGVNLNEEQVRIIDSVEARILAAARITIRGYCDRKQVENAKEVAIGRALAVRRELIRLGFEPAKIRIRYSTEIPGKHAAVFELHAAR